MAVNGEGGDVDVGGGVVVDVLEAKLLVVGGLGDEDGGEGSDDVGSDEGEERGQEHWRPASALAHYIEHNIGLGLMPRRSFA